MQDSKVYDRPMRTQIFGLLVAVSALAQAGVLPPPVKLMPSPFQKEAKNAPSPILTTPKQVVRQKNRPCTPPMPALKQEGFASAMPATPVHPAIDPGIAGVARVCKP